MLILASESPRRRELLSQLGIPFEIRSAQVEELEQADAVCSVSLLPEKNAKLKAEAVSLLYPEAVVLGADTAIIFNGQMIGKPKDESDARRILTLLSGHTHEVITGICLMRSGSDSFCSSWSEISQVTFKSLSQEQILHYMTLVHVLDKAGAYGIQDHGDLIISGYTGEMNTIIGLPLHRLEQELIKIGQKP